MEDLNAGRKNRASRLPPLPQHLTAFGLAATVILLLSAVWYQVNAKGPLSEAPHLIAITPAQGSYQDVYLPVTIHGTGFMPTHNLVEVGTTEVPDLVPIADMPSVNGSEIDFVFPRSLPRELMDNAFPHVLLDEVANKNEIFPPVLPREHETDPAPIIQPGSTLAMPPGEYMVRVITPAGTSNTLTFTLTP